jgi:hypothetical protein
VLIPAVVCVAVAGFLMVVEELRARPGPVAREQAGLGKVERCNLLAVRFAEERVQALEGNLKDDPVALDGAVRDVLQDARQRYGACLSARE